MRCSKLFLGPDLSFWDWCWAYNSLEGKSQRKLFILNPGFWSTSSSQICHGKAQVWSQFRDWLFQSTECIPKARAELQSGTAKHSRTGAEFAGLEVCCAVSWSMYRDRSPHWLNLEILDLDNQSINTIQVKNKSVISTDFSMEKILTCFHSIGAYRC